MTNKRQPAKFIYLIIFIFFVILGYILINKGTPTEEVAGAQTQIEDPNHPVEIYYGRPFFDNVYDMIDDLSVEVYQQDKIDAFPSPLLGMGSKITINRATPIMVTDAKKTNTYRTWMESVRDLLKEQNIELIGDDSVEPGLDAKLTYEMKIKITRVAEVEVTEKEEIDYRTIRKEDVDLERGQTQTEQKGIKGEKEVIYIVKRVDGEEVSRTKKDTKVIKEPQTEILIIGIGPKLVHNGAYVDTLNAAAKKYLINATALQCLMYRESGGSADAGFPDAMYQGLFQYDPGYWADASARSGFGGASIYDATAQIYTTAHEIANGQSRRWPPYAGCRDR